MRYQLLTTLLMIITLHSFGQVEPQISEEQTFLLPNETNQFINSSSVNWALDAEELFSFSNSNKIENLNIFNYIIANSFSGKIKAYNLNPPGFEDYENLTYSDTNKFPPKDFKNNKLDYILMDSLKTMKFHEIFYLDNYKLSCQIISAAPSTNHGITAGNNHEMQDIFYCCRNTNNLVQTDNNKDIVHLKGIERNINFDSIKNSKLIKQTYGLNLVQSIWMGAFQGNIKLLDLKTNKIIEKKDLMNNSFLDPMKVPAFDENGSPQGYQMLAFEPVFPRMLVNSIQFTQDFYYDIRRNVFLTKISNCVLSIQHWDAASFGSIIEKRFKVL